MNFLKHSLTTAVAWIVMIAFWLCVLLPTLPIFLSMFWIAQKLETTDMKTKDFVVQWLTFQIIPP